MLSPHSDARASNTGFHSAGGAASFFGISCVARFANVASSAVFCPMLIELSLPDQKPTIVPAGKLQYLLPSEIKPSTHNPRLLFDPAGLLELKKNIGAHGVLVPITVFQTKGQRTFSILDGERRFRCVAELTREGHVGKDGRPLKLPANIVEPPTKVSALSASCCGCGKPGRVINDVKHPSFSALVSVRAAKIAAAMRIDCFRCSSINFLRRGREGSRRKGGI
jgi:hypothetical protein